MAKKKTTKQTSTPAAVPAHDPFVVMVRMRRNQAYQQRAALDKIINTIELAHMAAYAMEQVPNEDLMGQGLEGAIAVLRDALGEARRAYWDGALSDLTFTLRHAAEGEQDEPEQAVEN